MELLQLKYFQTVARLEHMTKAAQSLHISQPALSKMIASLEAELGTELFHRERKTIRLNEHGRRFLQQVDNSNDQRQAYSYPNRDKHEGGDKKQDSDKCNPQIP